MQERKPLYMGKLDKESLDRPIDGIDTLILQSAIKMGAHVVDTHFATFIGTNYRREYAAQPVTGAERHDSIEGHPELTSV